MELTLIIIHVVISVALVVIVLMQSGKQQGLSGAIAGGAETFFGKNKGRTLDGVLKKITAVVALLFVISSILLFVYATKPAAVDSGDETTNGIEETVTPDENGADTDTDAGQGTDANAGADTGADTGAANE